MTLQQDGASSTFNKTAYFVSNLPETITQPERKLNVCRENSTSYSFSVYIHLALGEIITFYTTWIAKGQTAGNYTISVLAASQKPVVSEDPIEEGFRERQDTCDVQIVMGAPILNEPGIAPVHHPPGLDPYENYVYPDQNIEVICNVVCATGVRNVTLFHSLDAGESWKTTAMTRKSEEEWIRILPGQSEGKQIVLYVEAFSATEKGSKTKKYTCTVSARYALESGTQTILAATVAVTFIVCSIIIAWKKRRMTEVL